VDVDRAASLEAQLAALERVIAAASAASDEVQLLSAALDVTLESLDFEAGAAYVVSEDGSTASLVASRGIAASISEQVAVFGADDERLTALFRRHEPLFYGEGQDPNPFGEILEDLKTVAVIPVTAAGRLLGTLDVASRARDAVSAREQATLVAIGHEVGVALADLRLHGRLESTEERYARLVEAMPDGVTLMGLDGTVKWTSARTYEQFRSTPDVVIGRSVMAWLAPKERERGAAVIEGLALGHVDAADAPDYEMLRADGTRFHATVHAAVLRDAAGEPADLLVMTRDAESEHRARLEHETIAAIWRLFLESDRLEEVFSLLPDLLARVIGFGQVFVAVVDESGDQLTMMGEAGDWGRVAAPQRLAMEGTVNGLVATTGEAVLETDVAASTDPLFDVLKEMGAASTLAVPIRGRAGVLGVLSLSTSAPRPDLADLTALLQVVGDYLGLEIERKRSAKALTSSEDRFRNFIDRFDGIAYTWRPEAPDPVRMDGAVEEISGYSAADFEADRLHWFDIVHPDDLPSLRQAEELLLALPGYRLDDEYRILCRDGTVRWVRDVARRVDGAEAAGDPIFQGVVYDVTERRRSEGRVADSEGKLRRIFNSTNDAMVIHDAAGRVREVNETMLRMYGVSVDEVDGLVVADFSMRAATDPDTMAEVWQEILAGTPRLFEDTARRPHDGSTFAVEVYLCPIEAGGERLVLASSRDISERKAAEAELRANEQRLVRAQSIAHVGNWELDLRTRTMWGSHEARQVYGLGSGDSSIPLDLVQGAVLPEYRDRLDAALAGLIAGEDEYDVEFEIKRVDDGHVTVVHSRAELVRDGDGTPLTVVGALQDVSRLKAAEREALEAAARLRRAVEGTVAAMGALVETRDPYTAGHERRVTQLAVALADELGLEAAAVETLRLAGEVHDIGKVAVPAEILTRPGRLSVDEMAIVREHPRTGADILAPVEFGAPVADLVRWHHERIDGSGYPDGLAGDAIPLEARVLAVADVVEAMASHRPYRPALGVEAALAEIRGGAGSIYDAAVAAACERVFAGGFGFSG
jgi:PAS domain S-box-containing protein